ncbi:MAG: hypothetical protein U1E47_08490 [Rivihabitans pingtungensis]
MIPREASATLAAPESKLEALWNTPAGLAKRVAATLPEWDHGLTVTLGPAQLNAVLSLHDQAVLIDLLNALPDGMAGLSPALPDGATVQSGRGQPGQWPLSGGVDGAFAQR